MTWSQNYTPLADSIGLSALVAALPVVTLLALLAFWHVRAHLVALAGLLVAGVIAGFTLGLKPRQLAATYGRNLKRVRVPLLTIALGFTTRYSGTDTKMGLAFASTGFLFPFFSPLLGWLGVALTGSDTSSNVLFGNLQKVTAQQLDLSPILTAASNSSGGVMGKRIDAQSIVVASVATAGQKDSPDAGTILRAVFWHRLALATLMGILIMLQAYVFKWMIVVPPTVTPKLWRSWS